MLLIKVLITHTWVGTKVMEDQGYRLYPSSHSHRLVPPTSTLKSAANVKVIMKTICRESGVEGTGLISL